MASTSAVRLWPEPAARRTTGVRYVLNVGDSGDLLRSDGQERGERADLTAIPVMLNLLAVVTLGAVSVVWGALVALDVVGASGLAPLAPWAGLAAATLWFLHLLRVTRVTTISEHLGPANRELLA